VIRDGNLIREQTDPDSGQTACHCMPLKTIGEVSELLGLDYAGTVHALETADDPGVIDHATGRNAWTSAYEQAARDQLDDMNQPSWMVPAYKTSGALCADGRAYTRQLLGVDSPADEQAKPMLMSLMAAPADPLEALLAERMNELDGYAADFRENLISVNQGDRR
jgi:hypothetical protein